MANNMEQFDHLMQEAKSLASEGKLQKSLQALLKAKEIDATPRVISRIAKLKEYMAKVSQNKSNRNQSSESSPQEPILSEIQNKTNAHDDFLRLKNNGKDFAYSGKLAEALRCFKQALRIQHCPTVAKYTQEVEAMLANKKGLQNFTTLTAEGEKLASQGKSTESLQKLHKAYELCPSPKVQRMINNIQNSQKVTSDFKSPPISLTASEDFQKLKSPPIVEKELTNSTLPGDISSLSPTDVSTFKYLNQKARSAASEGRLAEALEALQEAKSLCPTPKVMKRIDDLKRHMETVSRESGDDGDEFVEVTKGFSLCRQVHEKLHSHQREGVAWMWNLHQKKKGGVLGDDMGLGKTFQVIAFLSGLIDADAAKHVLIIMPVSLIPNWKQEFQKWCPGIDVCTFHSGTKRERERNVRKVQRKGHVLLTSYGMIITSLPLLTRDAEDCRFVWDYVILDEGHKIKNPTKTTKAVHDLPSRHRLVLTGTPIQNNLLELWALYDFVHQGALLGSLKTFKQQYENVISRSREKDATVGERKLGTLMAENLKVLIKPYFLRRTKQQVWGQPNSDDTCNQSPESQVSEMKLSTRKNDFIVWIFLSEIQCELYNSFLSSDAVKSIMVSKRSPLVELTTLKKICDHPRLLSVRACQELGLNGDLRADSSPNLDDEESLASSIENVSDQCLSDESGKMAFLLKLLENLRSNNHRTLVFSLSRKILDMIHRILTNRGWKVLRLDGTVTKLDDREKRIKLFQKDSSIPVFLLTTQVGGVGLTLTAADRVVIYDPSWNPATDAQAVDRVYRLGQKKDVVVYRLITCGSVEEKIYRRQIFKDSITRQATCSDTSDPYRYFSKQELRELFSLSDPKHSATQELLSQMHGDERKTDTALDEHVAFLHSLNMFGLSDHDLMFSKEVEDPAEDNDQNAISHDFISRKVETAAQLIRAEAQVVEEGMKVAGTFHRPFMENVISYKKTDHKDMYKPPVLPITVDLTEIIEEDETTVNKGKSDSSSPQERTGKRSASFTPDRRITDYFAPKATADSPLLKNTEDVLHTTDGKRSRISHGTPVVQHDDDSVQILDDSITEDKITKMPDAGDQKTSEEKPDAPWKHLLNLPKGSLMADMTFAPAVYSTPERASMLKDMQLPKCDFDDVNLDDLSICEEIPQPVKSRKSCVRPTSRVFNSDSESEVGSSVSSAGSASENTDDEEYNESESVRENVKGLETEEVTLRNHSDIQSSDEYKTCEIPDEQKSLNVSSQNESDDESGSSDHSSSVRKSGNSVHSETYDPPDNVKGDYQTGGVLSEQNSLNVSSENESDGESGSSDHNSSVRKSENSVHSETDDPPDNVKGDYQNGGVQSEQNSLNVSSENECDDESGSLGHNSSASKHHNAVGSDDPMVDVTHDRSLSMSSSIGNSDDDTGNENDNVFVADSDSEADDALEQSMADMSLDVVPSSVPNSPRLGARLGSPAVRRIVPMHLRKSFVGRPDPHYFRALSTSVELVPMETSIADISLKGSPSVARGSLTEDTEAKDDSDDDSPVHFRRKPCHKNVIASDSE